MPETLTSVHTSVNCSIEDAFKLMTNPDHHHEFFGAVKEIKDYDGGPAALGDSWVAVSKFMGQEFDASYTVVEYAAPHMFKLDMTSPAGDGVWPWTFEEVDGGVEVGVNATGQTKGFLAAIAAPLFRRQLKNQITEDLQRFKAILEG